MPFPEENIQYITIPADAGPGQARIVITSVLPAPLNTYTFTDRAGYANRYSGGIIFYSSDSIAPIDTTYTYLCVVNNNVANTGDVHFGNVVNGVVQEYAAGFPSVQLWAASSAAASPERWISGTTVGLEANSSNGQLLLRGIGNAPIIGTTVGTGSIQFNSTGAGNIQLTATSTGNIVLTTNTGRVELNASGTGADVLITAVRNINLNASGGEIQVQGTRAYLLTQIQTNAANAVLNLVAAAAGIPNCTISLPTVTLNAKYDVELHWDVQNLGALNSVAVGELVVDGVIQPAQVLTQMDVANGNRYTTGQSYSGNLAAAGNHTFAFTGKDTVGAGNSQVQNQHTTIKVKIFETGG